MAQPQPVPVEDTSTRDAAQEHAKMKRQIDRLRRHAAATEQALSDQQVRTKQREDELNQQVGDLRSAVDIARKNLASLHEKNKALMEGLSRSQVEKDKATKSEVKYKKKVSASRIPCTLPTHSTVYVPQYHALKQEQARVKKLAGASVSAEVDDDSLIVLPP